MPSLHLIDKAFFLKKTDLFAELDLDLLLTIADKMEVENYKKGNAIFQKGSEPTFMYFIVEGKVGIKANDLSFALTVNESFGDESVLSGKQRSYDALAESDVRVLTLSHFHLMAILTECPLMALSLLESYAQNVEFRKRERS